MQTAQTHHDQIVAEAERASADLVAQGQRTHDEAVAAADAVRDEAHQQAEALAGERPGAGRPAGLRDARPGRVTHGRGQPRRPSVWSPRLTSRWPRCRTEAERRGGGLRDARGGRGRAAPPRRRAGAGRGPVPGRRAHGVRRGRGPAPARGRGGADDLDPADGAVAARHRRPRGRPHPVGRAIATPVIVVRRARQVLGDVAGRVRAKLESETDAVAAGGRAAPAFGRGRAWPAPPARPSRCGPTGSRRPCASARTPRKTAAEAEERAQHRLAEAEQGARSLREQVAEHVLHQQRTADDELRRARTEGAALVAAARQEADELRGAGTAYRRRRPCRGRRCSRASAMASPRSWASCPVSSRPLQFRPRPIPPHHRNPTSERSEQHLQDRDAWIRPGRGGPSARGAVGRGELPDPAA